MPPKAVKPWEDLGKQDQKKLNDVLSKIKANKFGDSIPEIKEASASMAEVLQILLKSTESQDTKIGKLEEEISDLKEIKNEFIQLRKEVGEWGKKFEAVEAKLQVLDDVDKNIKEIQQEQRDNVKRLGDACDKMEEERKMMEEMRLRAENEKMARDKAEVASCLIVMGLEKGRVETYKDLEQKVGRMFGDGGLGLTPGIADWSKVERFGPGKGRNDLAGPSRPPLVRITLLQPSMKSEIFGNIANLRGKEEFARVSIQNEVPKSLMEDYRQAVARAKSYREDCDVKTRISWAKGPMTVLMKIGVKWTPEEEVDEGKMEEMKKKTKK